MRFHMRLRWAAAAVLTLAAAAPARAAGTEALSAGAELGFSRAGVFAPHFTRGVPVQSVLGAAVGGSRPLNLVTLGALAQLGGAPKAPSKEVELAALLNRHLKTSLAFTMGGKNVWISGAFDRAQKAYVSVLEDGKAARFFNVEDLLTHAQILDVGSAKVRLSLSPDLSDQLESEIVLTNTANRKDQQRITLRDMLAAISAAGEPVTIGGDSYRLFYYDDIKNGAGDPSSKAFAFILTDPNGEFHVFLVPGELVPGDKIAVFKMKDDKPVGLQQAGGRLRLFDNP